MRRFVAIGFRQFYKYVNNRRQQQSATVCPSPVGGLDSRAKVKLITFRINSSQLTRPTLPNLVSKKDVFPFHKINFRFHHSNSWESERRTSELKWIWNMYGQSVCKRSQCAIINLIIYEEMWNGMTALGLYRANVTDKVSTFSGEHDEPGK